MRSKEVNNIPACHFTEGFLMICRGKANGGFHIQETHVLDKNNSVNRNRVSTPYDESMNV